MCTVTLYRAPSTLLVTMNRDEALMRGPERPPQRHPEDGVLWVAPHDSDRGGTWMGVNQYGVAACLLNAYRPDEDLRPDPNNPFPSRGEIIPNLLPLGSGADIHRFLQQEFEPSRYPSFTLLVGSLDSARCYEWFRDDGWKIRELSEPWHMQTSSGWDTTDVTAWRSGRFKAWRDGGCPMVEDTPTFHFLLEPGAEERSPLMKRSWSATRSVTQVRVDAAGREVVMRYWGTPEPGGGMPDCICELPLA